MCHVVHKLYVIKQWLCKYMYVFFQSFFYPLLFVDINSSEKIKKDRNRRGRGEEKSIFLRITDCDLKRLFYIYLIRSGFSVKMRMENVFYATNYLYLFVEVIWLKLRRNWWSVGLINKSPATIEINTYASCNLRVTLSL